MTDIVRGYCIDHIQTEIRLAFSCNRERPKIRPVSHRGHQTAKSQRHTHRVRTVASHMLTCNMSTCFLTTLQSTCSHCRGYAFRGHTPTTPTEVPINSKSKAEIKA
ncbi:unnamed protein product, partial [Ectocarpus sp. 12 AP-2014]